MKTSNVIIRAALCVSLSALRKRSAEDLAVEIYGAKPAEPILAILRSAVTVGDGSSGGWLSPTVGADVQAFLEGLSPDSAYAALAARGLAVDLEGNASVSVPFRSGAIGDVAGAWVGEGGAIPVKRSTLSAAALNRYKLAVISTLTKELADSSPQNAERVIEQLLRVDAAAALDLAAFSADAGVVGVRPPGLANGIAPIVASAASARVDAIAEDVSALVSALVAAGCGTKRAVLAVNSASRVSLAAAGFLRDGTALGLAIASSDYITPGDVFCVDAGNFASGLGTPEFEAGEHATLLMADDGAAAPTHATLAGDRTALGTAGQVPPLGGLAVYDAAQRAAGKAGEAGVAVSMFQQYSTALKLVLPVSWGKGRTGSVQWIEGASW